MNALVKHLVKRLAQREEGKKAIGMVEYVGPSCYKTHIYASMFYAKQKHPGCKKRRGQSEAAVIK